MKTEEGLLKIRPDSGFLQSLRIQSYCGGKGMSMSSFPERNMLTGACTKKQYRSLERFIAM